MMDSERTSQGTERTVGVFRRRAPWILLCFVLATGAAYGYSKHETKKYTAAAAVAFNNNPLYQQIAGLPSSNSTNAPAQQASNLELVKLGDMAAKTASLLGHGLTDAKVSASVSVNGRGESSVVEVAATSTSPVLAAAIANTYVNQFVKEQQKANRQFFASALALVKRQLASLPPAERFGTDGLDLEERAHTLSLLSELGYNNVQVAQEAAVPSSPSSPQTKRNTVLGAVLGLLLGIGVAFLLERFDRRVREPEELEVVYGLPMLGAVPKSAALSQSDGGADRTLSPADAEAFNLIRAHLRFFNIDREVRTIVIVSPAQGDGKTTIAHRLAESAAKSGSRVLLLEADLRHPTLAQQLGIQSGSGLADVLIGAISIAGATQSVGLPEASGVHKLDVLTAGAVLAPNPGELLESQAMDAMLEQVKAAYDLVVIDTPPLTAVSDAFPLLTKVDGVVIVGRVGYSKRDAAEELQKVLAGSGAPLLGVVANGAKSTVASSYYAGSGPQSPQSGGHATAATVLSTNGAPEDLVPTVKG